jgi:uncharacterized protein YecE (DUF72 family)
MRFRIGTSGFSYKEWKGSFYPQDLPAAGMLGYYASRLDTVEINNTFYRMPTKDLLEKWAAAVPESFTFVLKASQRITHQKRLKDAGEEVAYFLEAAAVLGARLGPVLFQTPPHLKVDLARLEAFLELLPSGTRAAFEFRHESWLDDAVYEALRAKRAVLCAADVDNAGGHGPPLVPTADWAYLRLRRADYATADLAAWAERIKSMPWNEAYVFFKHEEAGRGAAYALELARLV